MQKVALLLLPLVVLITLPSPTRLPIVTTGSPPTIQAPQYFMLQMSTYFLNVRIWTRTTVS